ncbi:MAG: putative porin [Saprospiraceae bacterium]
MFNKVSDCLVKFILVIFLGFYCVHVNGQVLDSVTLAKNKTSDSLNSIPLILSVFYPDGGSQILDSSFAFLSNKSFYGLSTLNNYGSPINSFRESRKINKQFDYGYHCLDFFQSQVEQANIYKSNKTYSELMVSQAVFFANSQAGLIDNLNAGAFLCKNFANNIDLNTSYERINQKGIYVNSRNLLGNLNANLSHQSNTSRWSYYLAYFNQLANIQHSGGIFSDSIIEKSNYQIREVIPVQSANAITHIKSNQYVSRIGYKLKTDSSFFNPKIELSLGYKTYINVMSDPEFRKPNSLYGLNFYDDTNKIERAYFQYTFPIDIDLKLVETEKIKLNFKANSEMVHLVQDSIYKSDIKSTSFSTIAFYKLKNSEFGLNYFFKSQTLDPGNQIQLTYSWNDSKIISILAEVFSLSQIPAWMLQRQYVNKRLIWENNFKNQKEKGIRIKLKSEIFGITKAEAEISEINNLIYLNSNINLIQESKKYNYIKLQISEDLSWKRIGFFNQIKYIQLDPDSAGWNSWYSRHELYLKSGLFKGSTPSKLSIHADYASVNNINGFDPILGFYYPYHINKIVAGPFIGVQLQAQVADLNVSLSFDHLDSFWNKKRPSLIIGYPVYDFSFEIRLWWRFYN